jgi:hypothetical protein
LVSDEIRAQRATTEDLLGAGWIRLIGSGLMLALSRPRAFLGALRLAIRIGSPGIRHRLLPLAYLLEASLLARRLRALGVQHLHNHIGRNSAAVAMLASKLSGVPYSLTIHGPTEFEMARVLALDEKIARSTFTVAISDFGRSQLMRFSAAKDWPKIHVVRCGLGEDSCRPSRSRWPKRRASSASAGSSSRRAIWC